MVLFGHDFKMFAVDEALATLSLLSSVPFRNDQDHDRSYIPVLLTYKYNDV